MQFAEILRRIVAKPRLIVVGSLALVASLALLLWTPSEPGDWAARDAAKKHAAKTPRAPKPRELVLFCATGLLRPVREAAAEYEKECGVQIRIDSDNSGVLLSKLRVAPDRADLFLTGEESFVLKAREQKLVSEVFSVARQHAVLAVQAGNPKKIVVVADLLKGDVRVVLPHPELTAVTRAVRRALGSTPDWEELLKRPERTDARVSFVGTVNEAAQAVKIDAADATFVWNATAREFALELIELHELQAKSKEQATLGVARASAYPTAAIHFARYLTACDRGQLAVKKNHFQPIADADAWSDCPTIHLAVEETLLPAFHEQIKSFGEREGVVIETISAGSDNLAARLKAIREGRPVGGGRFPDAFFASKTAFLKADASWFDSPVLFTEGAPADSASPEADSIRAYAVAKDSRHKHMMRRLIEAIVLPTSRSAAHEDGSHRAGEGNGS